MIGQMPDAFAQEMLELAVQMAADASKIALDGVGQVAVDRKADNSVVTETDHAIQARILESIAEAHPEHAVCAEEVIGRPEAHRPPDEARYCWVVDPLDGTRNYTEGLLCFSTAIAVLDRGVPIVAVVREHNLGHLYTAVRGGGATLNGRSVRADDRPDGADLLLAIPSSKDSHAVRVIHEWAPTRGLILRNFGSTALHLGMVASGALSAAFSTRAKIWDIAAGVLLVEEAGGSITDPDGRSVVPFNLSADFSGDLPFLAGSPRAHKRLLQTVRTG